MVTVAPLGDLTEVVDRHSSPSSATVAASPVSDLDLARAQEYLLLANLLRRAPGEAFLRELSGVRGDASALGMAHMGLADAARSVSADAASEEFFNLFIGIARGVVMPFGSYYLTGFLHDRPLARVREDMARLGIERQDKVFEPEDHIASLFEVMAGLVGGHLGHAPEEADRFFVRHIAPWADRLMADIAVAEQSRFYKAVAGLGQAWIEIEQEAMGLPQ